MPRNVILAVMLALLAAPAWWLGCGDEPEDSATAGDETPEVPRFLTEPEHGRPDNASGAGDNEEPTTPEGASEPDATGEPGGTDPDGEGAEQGEHAQGPASGATTNQDDATTSDGSPGDGAEEEPESGNAEDAHPVEDDGWSSAVPDFPEPPAGLEGGGAATPQDAATRFLTFLCTGNLDLYVSTLHPDAPVDEELLRQHRAIMLDVGLPTRFEVRDILDGAEVIDDPNLVVVAFDLHFRNGDVSRGAINLVNIGDDDQPRWVRDQSSNHD